MDVASLVIGLPPLIAGFWKIAQSINTLRRQFTSAPLLLASLEIQCHTLVSALKCLQSPIFSNAFQGSPQQEPVLQLVTAIVPSCQDGLNEAQALIGELQGQESLTKSSGDGEFLAKTKILWNEDRIKELADQLKGFQIHIGTLLTISQR